MSGPKPKTKAERQVDLNSKYGIGFYKLIKYDGNSQPATLKHECGQTFTVNRFESVLRGIAKCSCQHKKRAIVTAKDHRQEVLDLRGPAFKLVKFNGIGNTKNTYKHIECGHKWQTSYNSFKLSKHCPNCAGQFGSKLRTPEKVDVKKRIKKKFGNEYTLVCDYEGITKPALFKHKCGHKFYKKPYDLLRYGLTCEKCLPTCQAGRIKCVKVEGRTFRVRGYEPKALKYLVKKYGIASVVCDSDGIRTFKFVSDGKRSTYRPDFLIKPKKLVVEVKSLSTFGLEGEFFGSGLFERNCAKAKAVIKAGYKFELMLYGNGLKRIKLPKDWFLRSKCALITWLNS